MQNFLNMVAADSDFEICGKLISEEIIKDISG